MLRYAFLLKPHANARYRQSLKKLALNEARCLFLSRGLCVTPELQEIGGQCFLTVQAPEADSSLLLEFGRLSSVCLVAEEAGNGLIRPLSCGSTGFLPEDLPDVLKYKGKTNPDFTRLMINCARWLSSFSEADEPFLLYDPMCGKGTTLFCALTGGMDAVGTDVDGKDLKEADQYLQRSIQMNRVKFLRSEKSCTTGQGKSARMTEYRMGQNADELKGNGGKSLKLIEANASTAPRLLKPGSVHFAVCDLPYGVQHAPAGEKKPASLKLLAGTAAKACSVVMKTGGVLAFSYNEYTLSNRDAAEAALAAGLHPLEEAGDCSHWVEQAVQRNILFARKES